VLSLTTYRIPNFLLLSASLLHSHQTSKASVNHSHRHTHAQTQCPPPPAAACVCVSSVMTSLTASPQPCCSVPLGHRTIVHRIKTVRQLTPGGRGLPTGKEKESTRRAAPHGLAGAVTWQPGDPSSFCVCVCVCVCVRG